jgi:hypothetical protein
VETDQDANYGYKLYSSLLTRKTDPIRDASGFHKAVRTMRVGSVRKVGKGTAVLMNLSPQWYNAHRVAGATDAAKREVFMKHVKAAGPRRWVELAQASDRESGYEITYWTKGGRTIVFVIFNPEVRGSMAGGGNAAGLKTAEPTVRLKFADRVGAARDERGQRNLGARSDYTFNWTQNEALVVSFEGAPPR